MGVAAMAASMGGNGRSSSTSDQRRHGRRRHRWRRRALPEVWRGRCRRSSTTPSRACWADYQKIAPYFAVVGTTGHDSVARLKSCLRLQFTALFGGPATYPGVNDEGDTCVSMTAIHAGLGIPGAVFDKFVMDLGGVLKADGVADDDVTTIATAVTGLESQIVSPTPVEKTACDAGGAGGSDGGADGPVTLYTKYGAAIPKVVDDAVAGLTSDCQIAPYFAVVGTTGHDSVARLKSCLRLQFTALFGGPATYPGVNDEGDTCVSMTAIHAGLGIPAAAFDRFVMDFGGVLKADGVADEDIATIAHGRRRA